MTLGADAQREHEENVAAFLLARILMDESADPISSKVAYAEARLSCLTILIVEHLHDTRSMMSSGLLGSSDPELLSMVLNLRDPFGVSIASELLAWREVFTRLPSWQVRQIHQ